MSIIKVFVTGGTIDAETYDYKTGTSLSFTESKIPSLLKTVKCTSPVDVNVLMMKDSQFMTDEDREKILEACQKTSEEKILIAHGTDTMVNTAAILGAKITQKTIVLFGAMKPAKDVDSDAIFNLGTALAAVQSLPHGVYIAMNGRLFNWNNVRKNKEKGVFEEA